MRDCGGAHFGASQDAREGLVYGTALARPPRTRTPLQPIVASVSITFVSEPGYYATGKFGIRIENVMLVNKVKTKVREE